MSSLSVQRVSKRFGALVALSDVSTEFRSGEIHAVLGENGAGKSTLMNVMSGFINPDSGRVLLDGVPIPLGHAFQCKRIGIEMIHQHFSLVPAFTVAENLALARIGKLSVIVDANKLASPALDEANSLNWTLDPNTRTGQLPVGVQQRIEIVKAISGDAKVLIFDEPTAVLSPDEVTDLFRVLRRLKAEGKIVVLIAHKLSEVLEITDRVTVLRHGEFVATASRGEVDANRLAAWMVGELPPRSGIPKQTLTAEALEVKNLSVLGDRKETAVRDISFSLRQGEILGFGGVDGNGQIELAECLAQVRKAQSGSVTWKGSDVTLDAPRTGYVPQDRQTDGLALGMSVNDNLFVSGLNKPELSKGPFLRTTAIKHWADGLIERYAIKTSSPDDLAGSLSGGNQQKVVVSRALDGSPELLVVVNPGRGLDIKASQYVYERIREARDAGAAVALFSTDLDELFELSDRTLFLSRGRIVEGDGAADVLGDFE